MINENSINNLEDIVWMIEEFVDVNKSKIKSLQQLQDCRFNVMVSKDIFNISNCNELMLLIGDYYSCFIPLEIKRGHVERLINAVETFIKQII